MLTHSNIDRSNSVEVSPAPFTYDSTRSLNGVEITPGSFISFKVYITETLRAPVRLHSITPDGYVNICDSTGRVFAAWMIYPTTEASTDQSGPYVSSLLFDLHQVIAGHVCCTREVIDSIRNVMLTLTAPLILPANAFVLIPQCHVPMMAGQARSFLVNDTYITSDLNIHAFPENEAATSTVGVITDYSGEVLTVSLVNTVEEVCKALSYNTLCSIVVNGSTINCIDKDIIIKATLTSNLRVLKESGTLMLQGAADA